MSNKGDENQKPLMYIIQPSYDESQPAMQNIVRKRKKSEEQATSKKSSEEPVIEKSVQEPVSQKIEKKKEEPKIIKEREITEEPKIIKEREITEEPKIIKEREVTEEPKIIKEREVTEEPKIIKEPEMIKEREIIQEQATEQEQDKQPEGVFQETKPEPRRKRVKKPLNQMSIGEKVDFLTRLPHNMPRALCLIEAEGKTYRGIVIERNEDTVIIRTAGGGNPVELRVDHITSIHPLGF
ncbi:CotO family spore coat protein [Bacillus pumilus]|nr:CotO family spore coat protein [Bacillus pumilus]